MNCAITLNSGEYKLVRYENNQVPENIVFTEPGHDSSRSLLLKNGVKIGWTNPWSFREGSSLWVNFEGCVFESKINGDYEEFLNYILIYNQFSIEELDAKVDRIEKKKKRKPKSKMR